MRRLSQTTAPCKPQAALISAFFVVSALDHANIVVVIAKVYIRRFSIFLGVDVQIIIGNHSFALGIKIGSWLGLLERHRLLRLQDRLRHPGVAAIDARHRIFLAKIIKARVALRAGTLGAPFSLYHVILRTSSAQGTTRRERRAHCHSHKALSKRLMLSGHAQSPLSLHSSGPLSGIITVPGDKSISHRALMLGALAVGETRITGLLEGEDVLATAAAMRAMGATITRHAPGEWTVQGVGVGGLLQPETALDMGNSGTSTRLLMGLIASHPITATFVGDASLSRRPMGRVIDPLSLMGASVAASPDGRLPLTLTGLCPAVPLEYTLPVASAQVKSAILLAGLNTPGQTIVIEPIPTRDHSERMLAGFGATLTIEDTPQGRRITLHGEAELKPQTITVPGDPSSAAFPMVAALIVPGSDVTITNIGINPTRAGLIEVLQAMGANITLQNARTVGGEPVADLSVRHSQLTSIDVPASIAPSMIDEFPILFIAAALAHGTTRTSGLEELRVKESDRLATMVQGLTAIGVSLEEQPDGLIIHGRNGTPFAGGATIATHLDHRIAMSFAVASLHSHQPIIIDDRSPIATSFPSFIPLLESLGAHERSSGR